MDTGAAKQVNPGLRAVQGVLKYAVAIAGSLMVGIIFGYLFLLSFIYLFPQYDFPCGDENMVRRASSSFLVMIFVAVLTFACMLCVRRRGALRRAAELVRSRSLAIFGGGIVLASIMALFWCAADLTLFGPFYRTCDEPPPYYWAQMPFLLCQIPLYFFFCATIIWQLVTPGPKT